MRPISRKSLIAASLAVGLIAAALIAWSPRRPAASTSVYPAHPLIDPPDYRSAPKPAFSPNISVEPVSQADVLNRRSAESGLLAGLGGSDDPLTGEQVHPRQHLDLVHSPLAAAIRTKVPDEPKRTDGSAPMFKHHKSLAAAAQSPSKLREQQRRAALAPRVAQIQIERLEHRKLLSAQFAGDGLSAQYYSDATLTTKLLARVDPTINMASATLTTLSMPQFSVNWTGYIKAPISGSYTFYTTSDDGIRLYIDGKLLINHWTAHASAVDAVTLNLDASHLHSIRVAYYQNGGDMAAKLEWAGPSIKQQVVPKSALYSVGRQVPYSGIAFATGQTIQGEDYDAGGSGISFTDKTSGNSGVAYRSDNVDVFKTANGGYAVEAFTPGEWLEYTVDVPADGKYDLELSMAGLGAGAVATSVDRTALGTVNVPDTGGAENWTQLQQLGVQLTAGVHVLRLAVPSTAPTTFSASLDWLRVLPTASQLATTDSEAFVPQQIGTGQGADEKAIARWDVVPYQTFSGDFNVGAVAFHMNDIDHVDFSVEGGPWTSVSQMNLNPESGVVEYWMTIHAGDYRDGKISVQAVAYPKVGVPRVLENLPLNINAKRSLPSEVRWVSNDGSDETGDGTIAHPFATIFNASRSLQQALGPDYGASNSTIYLSPGDYTYAGRTAAGGYSVPPPTTNYGWLTICAAPGVNSSAVRIISSSSADCLSTKLVRMQGVTIRAGLSSPNNINAAIWFDHCELTGTGPNDNITFAGFTSWTGGIYATDTVIHDAVFGLKNARFQRNVLVQNIGSDAFMGAAELINCTVEGIQPPSGSGFHPDVLQYQGGVFDNILVYGLTAVSGITAQGLFGDHADNVAIRNAAFVGVRINNQTTGISPGYQVFQFCCPVDNMLIKDSSFVGPSYWRVDLGFVGHDVVLDNTIFSPRGPGSADGVTYR